jgi:hypothetical protein
VGVRHRYALDLALEDVPGIAIEGDLGLLSEASWRPSSCIIDFDKSILRYPNIALSLGGASNDLVPDLQHPDNPLPLLKGREMKSMRREGS